MQKMDIASADKRTALCRLDVIISVDYQVKSRRGVQFRQCALAVFFLGFFPNWAWLPIFGDVHVLDWAREIVSPLFLPWLS